MNYIEQFTKRIRDLREDNDLYQKDIADILGITQQQYSLYENGKRLMPIDLIKILARYYDVDMNYIAGITNKKRQYPEEEKKRPNK